MRTKILEIMCISGTLVSSGNLNQTFRLKSEIQISEHISEFKYLYFYVLVLMTNTKITDK